MPLLSICVATMPGRERDLERLLISFDQQLAMLPDRSTVEILLDDRHPLNLGIKRQAMLERTRGRFVCCVDDDDRIAPDYLQRLTDLIVRHPDMDAIGITGIYRHATKGGERRFICSMHHGFTTRNGAYLRPIHHLCPVRRDLAVQVGFREINRQNGAEDSDFAKRLRPLLRSEVSAGDEPIYFYDDHP